MIRTFGCTLLLVAATALLGARPAIADANWKTSSAIWRQMDNCTKAALKAYPDYTHESNARREALRRNCLRSSNLPGETREPPEAVQATEAKPPQ